MILSVELFPEDGFYKITMISFSVLILSEVLNIWTSVIIFGLKLDYKITCCYDN